MPKAGKRAYIRIEIKKLDATLWLWEVAYRQNGDAEKREYSVFEGTQDEVWRHAFEVGERLRGH